MINLKDIRLENDTIFAKVIPASKEDKPFDLVINAKKREIVKNTHGKMDDYVYFAMNSLLRSYDNTQRGKSMPKEDVVAWY